MCDSIHETGKCCGDCDKPSRTKNKYTVSLTLEVESIDMSFAVYDFEEQVRSGEIDLDKYDIEDGWCE